jgi:hypothetical protein
MFEGICEALHRELDKLEDKYSKGNVQMNGQDLQDLDKISHTLKCLKAYEAMLGSSEYGGSYDGGSYARARSRTTGRYMSRDDGGYYRDVPNGYMR